ncbi:MAG: ATP-dependent protease [Piscirickettsiaceae bacterium]|nr:MAG: ATP-dependent protease [Piscirickettsiaceae bacterium]PCI65720.1 MAG: ATP-dependent protease [Piscirickettsiaceae bacterium]
MKELSSAKKLTIKQLKKQITPDQLNFDPLIDAPEFSQILGQSRATSALEFGIGINKAGYNLYVAGETGTGRTQYITNYLKPIATCGNTPDEWLYVNNFETPTEPHCISLPEQQGGKLLNEIDLLIESLLTTFPAVFEQPSFLQKKNTIQRLYDDAYEKAISIIERSASGKKIALFRENNVITFTPIINGEIADEAIFSQMDEADRDAFHQNVTTLEQQLNEALLELPQWQHDLGEKLQKLHQQTIKQSLKPLFDKLQQNYQGKTGVLLYLAQVKNHLPRTISEYFGYSTEEASSQQIRSKRQLLESLYRPNLLVRSAVEPGLPVICESNPSYANLFGQINVTSDKETASVSFQNIDAGALHRANGGYLILDIEKVIADKASWASLKRALREGKITTEITFNETALGHPFNLKPEPVPLTVKIILIGSRDIYYALAQFDREFDELFQVFVDFSADFDVNPENLQQFAYFLHSKTSEVGIAELTPSAIALLAEYGCRLAEHQLKLSAQVDQIMEIAIEANHQRSNSHQEKIEVKHIVHALNARQYRNARLRDRTLEDVLSGMMRIATSGNAIGQVNGLSIIQVGETRFGSPIRITATVHPGTSGVIDIEREVELGMAVHSKGVLLLSGYLSGRYARDFPLAITAHIAIEQSYGFIDGDSASLAELCALLSALVDASLRQDIAVTGSVSQLGEVQAVGGVNEKIEGFFDICQARGLTGSQGVIIPATNQINLMLSNEVIGAVTRGEFTIYTVESVDQAMGLLTGQDMGANGADGTFPPNSINHKINNQLKHYAELTAKARLT